MQGSELRAIRKALGLNQAAFGQAMGLTGNFIALMERGEKPIERRTELAARYLALVPREIGQRGEVVQVFSAHREQARREALEEAAKVADAKAREGCACSCVGTAIRALKEPASPEPPQPR